jgi:hypothetical protein
MPQHLVVNGFDGAGDEQTSRLRQHWEERRVFQDVFDLDRGVVGDAGKLLREVLDNATRVRGPVEKIGIAEGDVLGAGRNLLADIRKHDIQRDRVKIALRKQERWDSGDTGVCTRASPRCFRRSATSHLAFADSRTW